MALVIKGLMIVALIDGKTIAYLEICEFLEFDDTRVMTSHL